MTSAPPSTLYTSVPSIACFWILLISLILAVTCSLLILYHFLFDRSMRTSLSNHVLIALLLAGLLYLLVDIPNYLSFVRLGAVWPPSPILCYVWCYIDLACFNVISYLMLWATVERHILLFHSHWLTTTRRLLLIHYMPILTIILYGFTFYAVVIFFSSCENEFDYTKNWCGYPCFYRQSHIMMYDTIVNCLLPAPLIAIINVLLLIRIVKQKQRFDQQPQWRRYRKMIRELLLCSGILLFFGTPMMTLILSHLCGVSYETTGPVELYFYFHSYFINICMPFACLVSSPQTVKKLKKMLESHIRTFMGFLTDIRIHPSS